MRRFVYGWLLLSLPALAAPFPALGAEEHDATEIAARAIASVAAANGAGESDEDLAVDAYDAVVRDLLERIETVQKEYGNVSRELENPLLELGKLYLSANQCRKAIPLLKQTTMLIRKLDGVMSTRQVAIYDLLASCFISEEMPVDLQQAQEQVLIINANAYGEEDVRMVPAMVHSGECYEQAGLYDNAEDVYTRAIRIAQKNGGDDSANLIAPLRAMARMYRLRLLYQPSPNVTASMGERYLEQATKIARNTTSVEWQVRVATLLDLGDWRQSIGPGRDSMKLYREAWNAAVAGDGPERAASLFDDPKPIIYRPGEGVPLRKPQPDMKKLKHYWIDYEFTVTKTGEVRDVIVHETTAPTDVQSHLVENLKRVRFRPSFANGEPRDVTGMRIKQGVWMKP